MKVAYSQVSPVFLKSLLITRYGLSATTEVVYLHQGLNDTYRVSADGTSYILRIYRKDWKPYDDIIGELKLIELLAKNHLKVASPVADREGQRIQQLHCPEGMRYSVLFTFAPGVALPALDEKSAQLFGEQLAYLHLVTEYTEIEQLSKSYQVTEILSITRASLISRLGPQDASLQLLSQIKQLLAKALPPNLLQELSQGVCHGDPHYENCFIQQQAWELTFFDFDFCGNGYLHYDLGSFFHYERNNPGIQDSFLAGYTRVRPLGDLQLRLIPYFAILMRLYHLGARAKNADGIKNPIWPAESIRSTAQDILAQLAALKN